MISPEGMKSGDRYFLVTVQLLYWAYLISTT